MTTMEILQQLTQEQSQLGGMIAKLIDNMKKDGASRKVQRYINERRETLAQYWTEFKKRHAEINDLNIKEHGYFQKGFYEQVSNVYEEGVRLLDIYQKNLKDKQAAEQKMTDAPGLTEKHPDETAGKSDTENQPGNMQSTSSKIATSKESNIASVKPSPESEECEFTLHSHTNSKEQTLRLKKQKIKMNSLNRIMEDIKIHKDIAHPKMYYEYKRWTLNDHFNSITALHEEITLYEEEYTDSYFCQEEYEQLEIKFQEVMILLHENQELQNSNARQLIENEWTRLPRQTIPMFEGNYSNWTAFRDIFTRVIHDSNRLGNAEKLQYLKANLKGEAARLIKHLEISDANYLAAWELINDRFNNKRALLFTQLELLLNQPQQNVESPGGIKNIHDTTRECIHAIKNLGIDTDTWGPIIIFNLIKKLDKDTRRWYEQSVKEPREVPDLNEFLKLLEIRFQSLENLKEQRKNNDSTRPITSIKHVARSFHSTQAQCKYCNGTHCIYNCKKFMSAKINERLKFVKSSKLCSNCLSHKEETKCFSQQRCGVCKQFHHTLLHQYQSNSARGKEAQKPIPSLTVTREDEQQKSKDSSREVIASYNVKISKQILLATAIVKVKTVMGTYELLRVLIDPGSQASFITERAAQTLGLPRNRVEIEITGVGNTESSTARSRVLLNLSPRFPSNYELSLEALILPSLTKMLPTEPTTTTGIHERYNFILADPTLDTPGPVDILLGADAYGSILLDGVKKPAAGLLAQKTEFGWILTGKTLAKPSEPQKVVSLVSMVDLSEQLSKFWEVEEVPTKYTFSDDDKICQELYKNQHTRNEDGTYTVAIPLKENMSELGDSRKLAIARLLHMEKRFKRDPKLKQDYDKFMKEYIELGHMKKVSPVNPDVLTKICYLPHQAVIKEDSTTTKLRVVFDASAKTSTGLSLNDVMYTGPRLQQNLSDILLRWRRHKYVFKADVEKMYRMIKVEKRHHNLQRILWRFSDEEPIREYALTTVTYGTASAPYLAVRTLQQLAVDEHENFPHAVSATLKDFYVDDLMTGADSIQESNELQEELIGLLKAGGFNLRKWSSNNKELLQNIPIESREQGQITISDGEAIKTLGVYWTPQSDTFQFKVRISASEIPPSKRSVLSDIAKLFDPLGWLSPIMATAKMIMQELWVDGSNWDEKIKEEVAEKWNKFRAELKYIETIKIPRWINYTSTNIKLEIHGFSDASEKAYAASVYSRTVTADGKIITTLLTAKTKIAPMKMKKTLPRLELCGAALLAKLLHQVNSHMEFQNVATYAWTDSMIVLAWIKGRPEKWKNFVGNKVAEIREFTQPEIWHHVKSEDNPADVASRGTTPSKLPELRMWWLGPSWLSENKQKWDKSEVDIPDTTEEMKRTQVALTMTLQQNKESEEYFLRFSKLGKLLRVWAYCHRFIQACRKRPINKDFVTAQEISDALSNVINIVQRNEFFTEIKHILSKKPINKQSKLISLNPFVDEKGILRVGGRIQNSNISYDEKHPIIIPHSHHITKLIIQEAHLKTLHGGNETTLAFTRRKYWIINARSKIRQELNRCVKCCRFKGQCLTQIMGVLPSPRVTPSKPFTHTGIDYAGPVQIRMSKGRGNKSYKGYISIFVCLTTKAIHIEAVSDMTTEAFLASFRRFTARRGLPSHIYSDNGTTFVGAKRTLDQDCQKAIRANSTLENISSEGVQWHFIPPAAPHFGGIWEAGVKSIKYHLKRVVGDSTLTYEELTTLLYQIEACLNSRPLYPITSDPNSVIVLTPGHFLVGKAILGPPEPNAFDGNIPAVTRWKQVQKMTHDFWKIWQREYLTRLQQRPKWKAGSHNIEAGRIVLIKDENCAPAKWPLAKIIQTHPGEDGVVRVVTLQNKENSIIKRPVTKICLLPTEEEETGRKPSNPVEETEPERTQQVRTTAHTTTGNRVTTPSAGDTKKAQSTQINQHSSTTKRKKVESNGKPTSSGTKMAKVLLTTMMVLGLAQSSTAQYTIKYPEPGLYIEQIGQTRLSRGTLRVELNLPFNITAETQRINSIVMQMERACKQSKRFKEDTHCDTLLEHLQYRKRSVMNELEILDDKRKRTKRGVLGKVLQYVFGVNDEIYTNIENLEHNQDLLRDAANRQTNIMLSTMSKINDTETRIIHKINLITNKLNKVITEVNKEEGWYEKIDGNKVSIHMLTAYQLSVDVLEEMEAHYIKILEATLGRSSLLDFTSPSKLREIINKASNKIPANLKIIPEPVPKLMVTINDTTLNIFGFLPITEFDTFNVAKVTPIPQRVKNNTYIAPDISASFLAINYDAQRYFELTEEEFKACTNLEKHSMLCTPTVVSNIETNPNCIIDEMYHRQDRHDCPLKEFTTPKVMWKHLLLRNTWLFIADTPTAAAVKCNGNREDILLKGIGIIQINQDCHIQTQKNILYSEIHNEINIKSTFLQPMKLNITRKISQAPQVRALDIEPILSTSDNFFSITQDSNNLQHLMTSRWEKIGHHTATATSSIFITLLIIGAVWKYRVIKKKLQLPRRDVKTETPDFVLKPREDTQKKNHPPLPKSQLQPLPQTSCSRPAECLRCKQNKHHTYAEVNHSNRTP